MRTDDALKGIEGKRLTYRRIGEAAIHLAEGAAFYPSAKKSNRIRILINYVKTTCLHCE